MVSRGVFFSVFCLLLLGAHGGVRGQESVSRLSAERLYNRGMELYLSHRYAAASESFAAACESGGGGVRSEDASYYAAVCGLRLGREDAASVMQAFALEYPASVRYSSACYELGGYYYRVRDYRAAISWYESALDGVLSEDARHESEFKLGYSLFSLGHEDAAFSRFRSVREGEGDYVSAARYYYGHIAYRRGLSATALEEFQQLEGDGTFGGIVPYYIAQIYYQQGEYGKVVEYVEPRLGSLSDARRGELTRAVAESHFRLGNVDAAIPHFDSYLRGVETPSREDHYLSGFLSYRKERYGDAAGRFEQVVGPSDSLSQSAYYHLADCYLRLDRRDRACQALQQAASMDFDRAVQADAQFNYAKLTYELRFLPFADAVEAFLRFIERFPDSPRIDEAYTYLGMAFSDTKNYGKALDALDKIRTPNATTRRSIQRAAYYRGVELMQNLRFWAADSLFARSLEVSDYDISLRAKALYWRGEASYRLGRYALAAKCYQDFLHTAGSYSLPEFWQAYYNLGYTYFKMSSYDQAIGWFRQFADRDDASLDERTDALARLGDCHFVQRKYWPAIDWYDRAVRLGGRGADYSLFQEGFSLGLVDRPEKKIAALSRMDLLFPRSLYRGETYYEMAVTYHSIDRLDSALSYYRRVVDSFPSSRFVPLALVQIGLAEYAQSNYSGAIASLQQAVSDYPGSAQMHEALSALERVYVAKGDPAGYFSYLESIGQGERMSKPQRDSLSYASAEALYMQGDCGKAVGALRGYLDAYPMGVGSVACSFYLADCLVRGGDTVRAIPLLEGVLSRGASVHAGKARRLLASSYAQRMEWSKAYGVYAQLAAQADDPGVMLEARRGLLMAAVRMGRDTLVAQESELLLGLEGLPAELALYARYHRGVALMRMGRLEDAYASFSAMSESTGSALGAEARYRMAAIRHREGAWGSVLEEVMSFARRNTPHQYWLAKSFLLLADAYEKLGDGYQARATLGSIVENYDGEDDVSERARQELARLNAQMRSGVHEGGAHDTIRFQFK